MPSHHDGPQSSHFTPLTFKGNAHLPKTKDFNLSKEMCEALDSASTGSCTAWGIPFLVNDVIILQEKTVRVDLPPMKARWLVFMHTSDQQPFALNEYGFAS